MCYISYPHDKTASNSQIWHPTISAFGECWYSGNSWIYIFIYFCFYIFLNSLCQPGSRIENQHILTCNLSLSVYLKHYTKVGHCDKHNYPLPTPCLTYELVCGGRSAKRRSKALNEEALMKSWNFLEKVKWRVKVRSKVRLDSFHVIDHQDQTWNICKPKRCQSATEGITQMIYKFSKAPMLSTGEGQGQIKWGHRMTI